MTSALSIAGSLLSPGPSYLIAAFQADDREARLEAIAGIFGLRRALTAEEWGSERTYAGRWLVLIEKAVDTLPHTPTAGRQELAAIAGALDDYAAGKEDLAPFWDQAVSRLTGRKITASTLRNRRWPALRNRLAEALAVYVPTSPSDVLPLPAMPISLFSESDFVRLLERLNGDAGGLVVLVDEPGIGKSEFALGYARWARSTPAGRRRYDRVCWLRANDPLVLEESYLRLGELIDPSHTFKNAAEVTAALQQSDRTLLVFDGVRDAPLLLRFLGHGNGAHVICTADVGAEERTGLRSAGAGRSLKDLQREGCVPWQRYFGVPLLDPMDLKLPPPLGAEVILRFLEAHRVPCDKTEAELLADRLGNTERRTTSRLALNLIPIWIGLYGGEDALRNFISSFDRTLEELRATIAFVDGSNLAGVVTAFMILDRAKGDGRVVFDGGMFENQDDSAFSLLRRLAAFAPHPIPVDAVRGNATDQRLRRLGELRLVVRRKFADFDGNPDVALAECFEIHGDVRAAMTAMDLATDPAGIAVQVAALTVLDRTKGLDIRHSKGSVRPEFFPHVVSLADRLSGSGEEGADVILPVTSVDLRVRAAAIQWIHRNPLRAAEQMRCLRELTDSSQSTLRAALIEDLKAGIEGKWSPDLPPYASELKDALDLQAPSERLRDLVVLLRRVGFRSGAAKLVEYFTVLFDAVIRGSKRGALRTDLDRWLALLRFEAALCYRENAMLSAAVNTLTDAREGIANEPVEAAKCDAFRAVLCLDRGDVRGALTHLRMSLEARRVHLGPVEPVSEEGSSRMGPEWTAFHEMARAFFVLARMMHDVRLPQTMEISAQISVLCWSVVKQRDDGDLTALPPSIQRAVSRANHALALAFERQRRAVRVAEVAAEEAEESTGRDHHVSGLVNLHHAVAMALSDEPLEAASIAEEAFRTIIRHWPRRHPSVLTARLMTAGCLADAGATLNALEHLLVVLDDGGLAESPGEDPDTPHTEDDLDNPSMRAAAWTAIGNLLLDAATHVVVEQDDDTELVASNHQRAPDLVDMAHDAFMTALGLLQRHEENFLDGEWLLTAQIGVNTSANCVAAELGALEALLRRGRSDRVFAKQVFERAHRLGELDRALASAVGDWATFVVLEEPLPAVPTPLELIALAKLVRSAPGQPDLVVIPEWSVSPWSTEFWESLLGSASFGERNWNARDRAEFALAWHALALERATADEGASAYEDLTVVQKWIELDIDRLKNSFEENNQVVERHPYLAIRYSALAQLPAPDGKNHRRGRNLREVDRTRVLLPSAASAQVVIRLEAEHNRTLRWTQT